MSDSTCRAALAELVEAEERFEKHKHQIWPQTTGGSVARVKARLDAAWAAARAALAQEAVPTGMTPFTESALTALESRIRADEREKLAALVAAKIMRVTSANSHRGKMTSVGSFAVGILEDLDAAIRNSDAAPVAE